MTNFYLKSGKDRFWVMKPFYEENILECRFLDIMKEKYSAYLNFGNHKYNVSIIK